MRDTIDHLTQQLKEHLIRCPDKMDNVIKELLLETTKELLIDKPCFAVVVSLFGDGRSNFVVHIKAPCVIYGPYRPYMNAMFKAIKENT